MQLHQIKPAHKQKKKKRIGRGGVHGFTSGKGSKGQNARSGANFKPVVREIIKRYGKLRGYKFKGISGGPVLLNFEILDKNFEAGQTVSPQILLEKRLVRKVGGKIPSIKILGKGELKKALTFEKCLISKSARAKIEKEGGKVN
jgi:large subunit ribosomal protein L15